MGWGWDYVKELASRAGHLGGEMVHGAESAWSPTEEGFDRAGKLLEEHPGVAMTVRPQGTSGHDIYLMFHGPEVRGTGSIDSSVAGWRKVSDCHKEAGDALTAATTKLGVAWQGATAESASANVVRLREAADTAGRQALHAGSVLEAQSSGWNDTAHQVTDVPADPPRMSIAEVDPVTPVLSHQQATGYTAGQQANQRALSSYGTTTSTNTRQVPEFAAPSVPGTGGQQPGSGVREGGSAAGTNHAGRSIVDSGPQPAETHSSWQVSEVMHLPEGGQAKPQEQAMPIAGIAAGAAGLIAGGSALMGATSAVGGSSIGARLAGGGAASGVGGSSTQTGRPDSGGRSGTGGAPEAEEETAAGGSRAAGARGRQDRDHDTADYLVDANPHAVFGQDRQVAPPVFGASPDPGPDEAD